MERAGDAGRGLLRRQLRGGRRARKSTLGGAAVWGEAFIKGWSKTMPIIALSSGESELAAVVRACTEGLGLRSILHDFGREVELLVRSDATAAIGMVRRLGLGKVRHLAVGDLWVQQRVRRREVAVTKWPGRDNPSDAMTKGLPSEDVMRHLRTVSWFPLGPSHSA